MSSIGLIVRSASEVDALPADWEPEALGERTALRRLLVSLGGESLQGADRYSFRNHDLWLELEIDDDDPPRSLTAAGVFGESEVEVLRHICQQLSARFYSSEEGRFAF